MKMLVIVVNMAVCSLALVSHAAVREGVVYEKVGVVVGREAVTLAPSGIPLKLAPTSYSSKWCLINYENRLHPEFGRVVDGRTCLYIGGATGKVDTALEP